MIWFKEDMRNMVHKTRIRQLLNGRLDIDEFMANEDLKHVFGNELHKSAMEKYQSYKNGEISEEMFRIWLSLCLLRHSKDFNELVELTKNLNTVPNKMILTIINVDRN